MTTATHTIVGAATGIVFHSIGVSGGLTQREIVVLGMALANLPDINLMWHRKLKTHHKDITHYPVFWLLMIFIALIFEFFQQDGSYFTAFLAVSMFLHLLMDTFGNTIGVHWLYPMSEKEYSFTKLRKDILEATFKERLMTGVKGRILYAEVFFWLISLSIIFLDF